MQDFCNGGALAAAMAAGVFDRGHPRHWMRTLVTLQQAACGMAYVHSCRVTHGDLNPSNILLKVRPLSPARGIYHARPPPVVERDRALLRHTACVGALCEVVSLLAGSK